MSWTGLASLLLAAALSGAAPAPAAHPPQPGVYKHRFPNGDVSGDSFTSENVLEIVRYAPRADYVRLHMEFYNGHMCDISGIARVTPQELVYDGPADDQGRPCTLHLQDRADGVHVFEDENGACRAQTCGARGGYGYGPNGQTDFTAGSRRHIRYMRLILASREYAAAVAAYQGRHSAGAAP